MTSAPAWSRGEKPSLEESATEAMQKDVAATKLHLGAVGTLPLNRERASRELTEEQRHNRGTRPRTRKWRALDRLDSEVDGITRRHSEAIGRLTAAEEALNQAPETDARTLAAWLAAGSKGDRPAATIYELQRDRDAARLLVAAVAVELDQALERRLRHVEKHREKMISDARKDIDDAHQQLLGKVNELPALRQALVDGRETLLWVASYPDPVTQFGIPDHVALGLMAPVERTLSTRARIAYTNLVAVLEEDAAAVAHTFSSKQREALGEPDKSTPISQAMWNDDPRAAAWRKSELERARAIGEYSSDLNRVADEARDFRQ